MTVDAILAELQALGSEQTKKTLRRHGAPEPVYGVKVADLKTIRRRVRADHALALALYDTGVADARYLAGLVADPPRMTKAQLRKWARAADWGALAEYTVAWVAAESRYGAELAREWIDSPRELVAVAGWATYSALVGITPDDDLDLTELEKLLDRVRSDVHAAPNRVRYVMNGFVIAVGSFVAPLTGKAKRVAKAVGPVRVDMGDTACQVPSAVESIAKVEAAGRLGVKRKQARC